MHVGIVLGSRSQWRTMQHTAELLAELGITYEARIITANKTFNQLHEYASQALNRGLEVIIAGASGPASLPDIIASKTEIPVLSVPIEKAVKQKKSTHSQQQIDAKNPEKTLNPVPGVAVNAALFAASMLAKKHPRIRENLNNYKRRNRAI